MSHYYKGICAVCGKKGDVVTVASRYGCCSHSLCKECLEKGRETHWNMVAYISCAGHFPDDINEEYRVDVYDSDNCLVYANVKHYSGTVTVYSNTKISGKICIVR